MSVKTGFTSVDLKYTETGNFLVANEKHSLVFYNPFTLSSLGFIEPANMRSSIIQFQVTAEGEYVCYTCEDNSVFIQKIDLDYLNRY